MQQLIHGSFLHEVIHTRPILSEFKCAVFQFFQTILLILYIFILIYSFLWCFLVIQNALYIFSLFMIDNSDDLTNIYCIDFSRIKFYSSLVLFLPPLTNICFSNAVILFYKYQLLTAFTLDDKLFNTFDSLIESCSFILIQLKF